MKSMSMLCRPSMPVRITVPPAPTYGEGRTVGKLNQPRSLTAIGLIALLLAGLAQPPVSAATSIVPASPTAPETVVQVRGKESIVQELNMGPDATEFWRKLQILIANPNDIQDFSKLVKLFQLTITEPVDAVSPKKPGFQQRYDLKTGPYGYMVERGGYAIAQDAYDRSKRVVNFTFAFQLDTICISSSEVRRLYGKGNVGIPSHGAVPPIAYTDTAGLMFSESYGEQRPYVRRPPLIFSYVNSGCLKRIHFQQPVAE